MRTAVLYNFLLEANVMASIAVILMIVVRRFFRPQLGSRAIRFAWVLVAARLLLPISLPNPFINDIRPGFLADAGIRPIAGQIKVRLQDALETVRWAIVSRSGENALTRRMLDTESAMYNGAAAMRLMQWYLVGVAVVLLWFVVSNAVFRAKLKAGRIEPISGALKAEYERVCAERGVKPVPVYFTDPLPSACLVGVFRPFIALPLTARPDEAIYVLTHEVCHHQAHDNLWAVVRMLCCGLHWFNPLVWAAAWMSRADCELACDERVIAGMEDAQRRAYAGVLVLAASRRATPGLLTVATGMTMTGRSLKERVDSILRSGRVKRGLALAFAVLASMCLIGAFATSEVARVWQIPLEEMDADLRGDYTVDTELLAHYAEDQEDLDAFALGLWDSSYLREYAEAPFAVQRQTGDPRWWIIDKSGLLTLVYDQQGRLQHLMNAKSGYEDGVWISGEVESPVDFVDYEKQVETLQHFVRAFAPHLWHEGMHFPLVEEYRRGSDYFAYYVIAYDGWNAAGTIAEEKHIGQIVMQLAPVPRVVMFLDSMEGSSYSGNG